MSQVLHECPLVTLVVRQHMSIHFNAHTTELYFTALPFALALSLDYNSLICKFNMN